MANADFFLKIDTVPGESKDDKHKDEIQLVSWSWGETNNASFSTGGGGGSGKVQMQDFHFVMPVSKASPKLLLACANGEHIKSATLTCRKAGKDQQEYLIIKFTDLLVSSFQTGGSTEQPLDQISMAYSQINYDYKPQKQDGTLDSAISAGWNVQKNVKA